MGALTLSYTANTAVSWVLRKGVWMHVAVNAEVGATLGWLAGALEYAYTHGQVQLLAYLEAVVEEVLFDVELGASS